MYIKFWCDLNIIIRIECILLKFHWGMKALIELHFQHEALPSYPNERGTCKFGFEFHWDVKHLLYNHVTTS
jgi:hypothetical protein